MRRYEIHYQLSEHRINTVMPWLGTMAEKSVLDPALRPMVTAALAQPVLLGKWPEPLRKQWYADRRARTLSELGFVLKLGFALALAVFLTDWLIVRDLAYLRHELLLEVGDLHGAAVPIVFIDDTLEVLD